MLRNSRRAFAALSIATALGTGLVPAAAALPPGLAGRPLPPGLEKNLDRGHVPPGLSNGLTSTPEPQPQPELSDVVPDPDFRRHLNTYYLDRADTPDAPISAADMATITKIGAAGPEGRTSIPDINGEHVITCGPKCTKPAVEPNLEGLQYAVNLEELDISFVGQMPELGTFPKLRTMDFLSNTITDYSWLSGEHFPALSTLTLRTHDINLVLPAEFATLSQLTDLHIMATQMTELPVSVTELPNLKTLKVSWATLTTLPESIGNLTTLEELNLAFHFYIKGDLIQLPQSMGNLENLRRLSLPFQTQLSALPKSMATLPALEYVNLGGTPISEDNPVVAAWLNRGVEVVLD